MDILTMSKKLSPEELTQCKPMMKQYLLKSNFVHNSSVPVSIVVGIIVFLVCNNTKKPNIIVNIVYGVAVGFVVLMLLRTLATTQINKTLEIAVKKCHEWQEKRVAEATKKAKELPEIIPEEVMNEENVSAMLKTDESKPVQGTLKLNEEINNLNLMPSGIEHMAPGGVSAANADDTYYNVMDERKTSCFVGSGKCSPLCSGAGGNPCNLVAPIPSAMWQPQSASKVQDRLNKGEYVPSTCKNAGKMRYGYDKDCAGNSPYVQSMYITK